MTGRRRAGIGRALVMLAVAVAAVAATLIITPPVVVRLIGGHSYSIPSGAMEPSLVPGDRLLALPIWGELPARGAVVTFLHPHKPGITYVKRLIAFAGETVQMRGGVVLVDGEPAVMERLADRVVPWRRQGSPPAMPRCRNTPTGPGGDCLQERWRETLPDGTSQVVLNVTGEIGADAPGSSFPDETPVFTVPEGHIFVLGDHRDNAIDSRASNLGMVPVDHLRHVAWVVQISLDWSEMPPWPRWGRFFRRVE